jgi:hypothetical protein
MVFDKHGLASVEDAIDPEDIAEVAGLGERGSRQS